MPLRDSEYSIPFQTELLKLTRFCFDKNPPLRNGGNWDFPNNNLALLLNLESFHDGQIRLEWDGVLQQQGIFVGFETVLLGFNP